MEKNNSAIMISTKLLDNAFSAIRDYLYYRGWKQVDDITSNDLFQLIDPQTGRTHDTDYAFTLECNRSQQLF